MLIRNSFTLFAVVRETSPGSGVWAKHAEQDNYPDLTESTAPTGAIPSPPDEAYVVARRWQWSATITSGMPGGSIDFEYPDGDWNNPVNRYHQKARLKFINFSNAGTWHAGGQVLVDIDIANDLGESVPTQSIIIDLRTVEHIEFTVIKDQADTEPSIIHQEPTGGSGSSYTWTPDAGSSGLSPAPIVTFSFLGGDTKQMQGRISVVWGGAWDGDGSEPTLPIPEGVFSLSIADSDRPDSIFDGSRAGSDAQQAGDSQPRISLRSLKGMGYTLITGQVSGGEGISAPPFTGSGDFTFTPLSLPAGVTLILGTMGQVMVFSGSTSGSFDLEVKNGERPSSFFNGLKIDFRTLAGDGYTLIAGQISGGDGIDATPPAGTGDYTFTPSGLPAGVTLTLGTMGQVIGFGGNTPGSFDLEVKNGERPSSFLSGRKVDFRNLAHNIFYWFDNQTAVDPTTINENPSGASYDWSSSDARVVISDGGGTRVGERITGSGVTAGTDVDFNLNITDGNRPGSVIPCTLKARHVKDPNNIPYSASSGSETVEVTGDSVTVWKFGAGVFSGIESVLSFTGGVGNTASISWGDNALNNDDSGTLTFTIQPNDASAPSCTVLVNVNISVTTNIVDITKPTVIDCTFEIV